MSLPPLPADDHDCPSCGISYADLPVGTALQIVADLPGEAAAAMAEVPARRVRVAPDPGTWSPVEYLCHLRDVAVTSTIRLYRARTEERPVLEPMLNDLRARRFRYVEADPPAVMGELARAVAGLADEIARVRVDGWERTVTRLPGEERTARWLVRHAAHEGRHHVDDLRRAGTVANVVRPREEADIAVLAAILRDVHLHDGYPVRLHPDPGAWLCCEPVLGAWVADHDDGWVVGHVGLCLPGPEDPVAALVAEPAAIVNRLFVARDARGQGLGERLVRAAWREARQHGLRPMQNVLVDDAAAVALYDSIDWHRIGTITREIGEDRVPAICFAAP